MNQSRHIVVIGGGIAGLDSALTLSKLGFEVTLLEKEPHLGGKLTQWHHLFPDFTSSESIYKDLIMKLNNSTVRPITNCEATKIDRQNGRFAVATSVSKTVEADAILLATGFELFDASRKEEYGYGIYKQVVTSADLEKAFREGAIEQYIGGRRTPKIAILHCVGSRDKKCDNIYCSRVCCVTGVKQAIELKKLIPQAQISNFYMDLRMYGQNFEELYIEAQQDYGITYIRGRVSELAENIDQTIQLKSEDTLTGRPLKGNFDLVVLLVGMSNSRSKPFNQVESVNLSTANGFLAARNRHLQPNVSLIDGIFIAGTAREPLSIQETLTDAKASAITIQEWFNKKCEA